MPNKGITTASASGSEGGKEGKMDGGRELVSYDPNSHTSHNLAHHLIAKKNEIKSSHSIVDKIVKQLSIQFVNLLHHNLNDHWSLQDVRSCT